VSRNLLSGSNSAEEKKVTNYVKSPSHLKHGEKNVLEILNSQSNLIRNPHSESLLESMNSSVTQDKKKSKAKEENPDGNMFVEDSSEVENSN